MEAVEARLLLSYTFTPIPPTSLPADVGSIAGINDSGEFAGGTSSGMGFSWIDGSYSAFNVPGAAETAASELNNSGQTVGTYNYQDLPSQGFLLDGGGFTTISPYPGRETFASGINNAGEIVGWVEPPDDGDDEGFLYSSGIYTSIEVPGSVFTYPESINDSGQVVGWSDNPEGGEAEAGFLLSGGTYTTLDFPNSTSTFAQGINDSGQVVGYYYDSYYEKHGFVFSNGNYATLDLPGRMDTEALAINGSGVILVTDLPYQGEDGYFLATPSVQIVATAPSFDNSGDLDYGYTLNGDLPEATAVDLDWATGTTADTVIGSPIITTTTETAAGTYDLTANPAQLGDAPEGAKYLLVVADPDDEVDEEPSVASVAYDPFQVDSATSPDPEDLSVTYEVDEAEPGVPLEFGVYRSSSPIFDPATAILVNTVTQGGDGDAFDESVGDHTAIIDDPSALLPDPHNEYVFVVADPDHVIGDPEATYHAAQFRKFVLGVVVHGLEPPGAGVPQWETDMATDLVADDGLDAAIPFDWTATSDLPESGQATAAGNRLAAQVISDADGLASAGTGDVVDLVLIGHSRGAVVISQALQDLDGTTDPALAGGYVKMTLLDPHPANNQYGSASYSFLTPVASLAAYVGLHAFQALAQDPQVVVPSNVDSWEDYYQHTQASPLFGLSAESVLNLWGDDPDLIVNESDNAPDGVEKLTRMTLPGVGLIGHSEVPLWYLQNFVETDEIFESYSDPGPRLVTRSVSAASNDSPAPSPAILPAGLTTQSPTASSSATTPRTGISNQTSTRMILRTPIPTMPTRPNQPVSTDRLLESGSGSIRATHDPNGF